MPVDQKGLGVSKPVSCVALSYKAVSPKAVSRHAVPQLAYKGEPSRASCPRSLPEQIGARDRCIVNARYEAWDRALAGLSIK